MNSTQILRRYQVFHFDFLGLSDIIERLFSLPEYLQAWRNYDLDFRKFSEKNYGVFEVFFGY